LSRGQEPPGEIRSCRGVRIVQGLAKWRRECRQSDQKQTQHTKPTPTPRDSRRATYLDARRDAWSSFSLMWSLSTHPKPRPRDCRRPRHPTPLELPGRSPNRCVPGHHRGKFGGFVLPPTKDYRCDHSGLRDFGRVPRPHEARERRKLAHKPGILTIPTSTSRRSSLPYLAVWPPHLLAVFDRFNPAYEEAACNSGASLARHDASGEQEFSRLRPTHSAASSMVGCCACSSDCA
jgi:hypothetical protein